MLDPQQANDRRLFIQQLSELNAERIENEMADQHRAWKLLLEEKNRATIERIMTCKIPGIFETELNSNAPQALQRHRTN